MSSQCLMELQGTGDQFMRQWLTGRCFWGGLILLSLMILPFLQSAPYFPKSNSFKLHPGHRYILVWGDRKEEFILNKDGTCKWSDWEGKYTWDASRCLLTVIEKPANPIDYQIGTLRWSVILDKNGKGRARGDYSTSVWIYSLPKSACPPSK